MESCIWVTSQHPVFCCRSSLSSRLAHALLLCCSPGCGKLTGVCPVVEQAEVMMCYHAVIHASWWSIRRFSGTASPIMSSCIRYRFVPSPTIVSIGPAVLFKSTCMTRLSCLSDPEDFSLWPHNQIKDDQFFFIFYTESVPTASARWPIRNLPITFHALPSPSRRPLRH